MNSTSPQGASNQADNAFTGPFVLDRPKLTRILTIIEEYYVDAEANFAPRFLVTLKKGRELRVANAEALFSLDNAVKNPVTSLRIEVDGTSPAKGSIATVVSFESRKTRNVTIGVEADDVKLAREMAAELEEQAERTMMVSRTARVLGSQLFQILPIAFGTFLVAFVLIGIIARGESGKLNPELSIRDTQELAAKLPSVSTMEQKIDFLFDFHRRQIHQMQGNVIDVSGLYTWQTFFLALPFLVTLICIFYMTFVCYPRTVFVWGDWEQHYADLVSRRHTLWTVVIVAILVGIVGTLFSASVARLLK